ncbi:glycoside hydrolase family 13 protein [Flavobacterium sp. UGB4466]|nr:glycoside hydrolase family 13 protein [Flavobacterium sp. UGB4466]
MKYKGGGIFKIGIDLPKGKFFYHFFFNNKFDSPKNDEQFVISKYDYQKKASFVLETEIFCPIQFSNKPHCISHIKDDIWEVRLITHQKWISHVALVEGTEEYPFSIAYTEKNVTFWFARLKFVKSEINFCIKFNGSNQTKYLHDNHKICDSPITEFLFTTPLEKRNDYLPFRVGYQVFPDRFHRIPEEKNSLNLVEWGGEPTYSSLFGGNIKGIISKLDYIAGLGFDFIFLNPIFFSKSYHRYDCIDYERIDPVLGDEADFNELIEKAHRLGLKVILDISLNHCSTDFFAFKDILENQAKSAYLNWFEIEQFPLFDETRHYYSSWHGYKDMPQFNFDEKEVQQYFMNVARYWPQKFNIDGWRLDVASEMPVSFIKEFVTSSRKVKPDLMIIGELWDNSLSDFVVDSGLDGITNFSLYLDSLIPFFQYESVSISNLVLSIMKVQSRNSFSVNQSSWNFLSNHDIARFYSIIKDKRKYSLAFTLIYGIFGTPIIYYGEENCMNGLADPDNRQCMEFESGETSDFVHETIKKLNRIKAAYENIFNFGSIAFPLVDNKNKVMIIQRSYAKDSIFLVFNFDDIDHQYLHPITYSANKEADASMVAKIKRYSAEIFFINEENGTFELL